MDASPRWDRQLEDYPEYREGEVKWAKGIGVVALIMFITFLITMVPLSRMPSGEADARGKAIAMLALISFTSSAGLGISAGRTFVMANFYIITLRLPIVRNQYSHWMGLRGALEGMMESEAIHFHFNDYSRHGYVRYDRLPGNLGILLDWTTPASKGVGSKEARVLNLRIIGIASTNLGRARLIKDRIDRLPYLQYIERDLMADERASMLDLRRMLEARNREMAGHY